MKAHKKKISVRLKHVKTSKRKTEQKCQNDKNLHFIASPFRVKTFFQDVVKFTLVFNI